MKSRYEVILAGTGGQGLVISGIMLANAAILDGKNAVQTQTYGIAQRGGFSSAEVIADEEEILYQHVEQPDIIIALNQSVISRYKDVENPVLYDSGLMHVEGKGNWHGFPFAKIALDLGESRAANLVAIGAMLKKAPMVSMDSLITVIRRQFKSVAAERNIQAVYSGMKLFNQD